MKVCVFEWISGGGCWLDKVPYHGLDPDFESFKAQGLKMLGAVIGDFLRAGHEVKTLLDSRLDLDAGMLTQSTSPTDRQSTTVIAQIFQGDQLRPTLIECAEWADAILLIAPETGGCLAQCARWLTGLEERMISPDIDFIELTSNKHATCTLLASQGVAVPTGWKLSEFERLSVNELAAIRFPLVIKPLDGAGSEGVHLITEDDLRTRERTSSPARIEAFLRGTSASVSVIAGSGGFDLLPPTSQVFDAALSRQGMGHYVSTAYPLPGNLAERATELAARTVTALPATQGYFGIDMILGPATDPMDCVIEVNPRLTMSYVRLRELCDFNLAQRMLDRKNF